jgi:cellulose synthase/poly-beta-1,6-N-acetylglucosamine synthase-like glycosyltransferase
MGSLDLTWVLVTLFIVTQSFYLASFLVEIYFFSLPVNWVRADKDDRGPLDYPFIVLLYPVLHELESTMRTTFGALARLDYPRDRFEVVAVPNSDDAVTIASLRRMQADFPFLQILETPSTIDPSWRSVWDRWAENGKAYWWHEGSRAGRRDLPPKKTRQLIYAFYTLAERRQGGEDFLVNYLDADSAPQSDHFMAAAHGMRRYDVLQATNIAGNLNATMAASLHAFDHMAWDGRKYPHMSANGRHPYWVLGKGLFFRASDLLALGGFNPWITIEDPEVGMRFWKNGRRLGIIETPLIEEVPETFSDGIKQRKRWVAGFWQSLGAPLTAMDFTVGQKLRAWLNFIPCLSLWVNLIGLPVGIWALVTYADDTGPLPVWTLFLAAVNAICYLAQMATLYWATWKRTKIVLSRRRDRLWYLLRVNPLVIWVWWGMWLVPLWIGWRMFRRDHGLVWERTEKIDANAALVRGRQPARVATPIPARQV